MLLNLKGISKKYYRPTRESSHFEAARSCDLQIQSGRVTEIIGRSGSGKSTLLYMASGLLAPDCGKVLLDEKDLYAMGDKELSQLRNKNFGVIPQGQTGLFALNVLENVKLPATLYDDGDECEERALELLDMVGIRHLAFARLNELSGGELRRMAVARALLLEPKIIFADEPTDDLDDENTRTVLSLLRSASDHGAAVLLVTHESEARNYADSIYRMDGGKLLSVS